MGQSNISALAALEGSTPDIEEWFIPEYDRQWALERL